MPHVVVIGGGVTGLVAAFRLAREPGLDVTLLEARKGVGGKINTVTLDGARIELGPDSFLPRDDRPLQLCREIGIANELVEPSDFGGWVYRQGSLMRLPAGSVLGFPASVRSLFASSILSPEGRLRAAGDLLNRRPLSGPDVSVGSFARSRLGAQVVDRIIDPLLAGTRAGDVEEMSLAAAIPPVDAAARSHRSVILGLKRARTVGPATRPRFYAPREGMHRLVEALEDAIPGVEVRRDAAVGSIESTPRGFAVHLREESLSADAVVVATPAHAAAKMLADLSPDASRELAQIQHAASAVVNLLFAEGSIDVPDGGSGVLVPTGERMTLTGCTWFSRKWPASAAGDGRMTVRCFVGRGPRDPALELGDRDLAGVVVQELGQIVSLSDEPTSVRTTRWDAGLPLYRVGHLDRVARIEAALGPFPRLRLAGASYRGSGIPDCIAQAEAASAGVLAALRG